MIRCGFDPYEGVENYIFVSYAHKDAKVVFPIIESLHGMGYRIWYDDGIAPGSEWPEDIANHLNGCAVMMSFVSPNSLASDNCRREITYALAKKKPFLGVILEPVKMSPGIEMQLSAQQCVVKYSYRSEEAFLKKLCSCQSLAGCREIPVEMPAPASVPVVHTPKTPDITVQAPPVPAEKRTAPTSVPPREKKPLSSNHKKWMLFGGIGLACLLLLVLAVPKVVSVMSDLKKIQIVGDKFVNIGEDYLYLYDETISVDAASRIAQLTGLKSLTMKNCRFEPGALAKLRPLTALTSVEFTDCTGVDDLTFLQNQPALNSLKLINSGITDELFPAFSQKEFSDVDLSGNLKFTDLSKLSGCQIRVSLDVSNTGVKDLSGLQGLSLTQLYFSGTGVSDISVLGSLVKLVQVRGANTKVTNIDVLSPLTNLLVVDFTGCRLENVSVQFQSLRLRSLYLSNTGLTNLDAFSDLTVLQEVDIYGNSISDIAFLAKNAATMKKLDVSGNLISTDSLAFLSGSPELTHLYMDEITGKNLEFLRNCTKLEELSAVHCGIQDISALERCRALKSVLLAGNQITDISSLKYLTTKWLRLDLSLNPLKDASNLPRTSYSLLLLLCPELDPATIPDLEGNVTAAYYSENLEKYGFNKYIILGCPADKQVELENSLQKHRLQTAADMKEVVRLLGEHGFNCWYLQK